MTVDESCDVLIVGSGAAGLLAALVVAERGLRPLVIEGSDLVGGSSALSGGGLWMPDNPLMRAAGVPDSPADARRYLDEIIGDVGPASSAERRDAFVRAAPKVVEFLQRLGTALMYANGYPDYYPERPGGRVEGRGVESRPFNGRRLGPWLSKVRVNPQLPPVPLHTTEVGALALATRTSKGFWTVAKVLGGRTLGRRLLGQIPVTMGRGLIAQLLHLAVQRSVPIWLDSPMTGLTVENGRIAGAAVERDGARVLVRATRGVLLAAGGFARNDEMRRKHHPHPITTQWSSASPTDQGDAVRAGITVGAATALMDDAWWGPTMMGPTGPIFGLWERSFPGSIIVDGHGQRFMNESASYVDCGHAQYERHAEAPAIPAWLVIDSRHRRRYPFGTLMPGLTPKSALESGFLTRAGSIAELAALIGVDRDGLTSTVERFNGFAATGRDEDFHRGDSAYDRFYGDPRNRPNPNLGALDRAPFFATRIYPGDLGTKGGLLTDEHGRVLGKDGAPIDGLYAAGNTTASVMGRTYPGPGATLGAATAFAYLAMRHATADPQPRPDQQTISIDEHGGHPPAEDNVLE